MTFCSFQHNMSSIRNCGTRGMCYLLVGRINMNKLEPSHHCPTCKLNHCALRLQFHNQASKTKDHASQVKSLNSKLCDFCSREWNEECEANNEFSECQVRMCDNHKTIHNSFKSRSAHANKAKMIGNNHVPFSNQFKFTKMLADRKDLIFNFRNPSAIEVDTKNKSIYVIDKKANDAVVVYVLIYSPRSLKISLKLKETYIRGLNDDGIVNKMVVKPSTGTIMFISRRAVQTIKANGTQKKELNQCGKSGKENGQVLMQDCIWL